MPLIPCHLATHLVASLLSQQGHGGFCGCLRRKQSSFQSRSVPDSAAMFQPLGRTLVLLSSAFGFSMDHSTCQAELQKMVAHWHS